MKATITVTLLPEQGRVPLPGVEELAQAMGMGGGATTEQRSEVRVEPEDLPDSRRWEVMRLSVQVRAAAAALDRGSFHPHRTRTTVVMEYDLPDESEACRG